MMAVKKGDQVKVDYEGRFESGEVFDSSSHGDHSHPLEFECGAEQVIKGFDDAILGMNIGEEKEITISPEDAYGKTNEDLIKELPIDMLPKEQEPKEGMMLMMKAPSGQEFPVKITKVGKKSVTIDINHPMAGKTLIFKIKLLEIGN